MAVTVGSGPDQSYRIVSVPVLGSVLSKAQVYTSEGKTSFLPIPPSLGFWDYSRCSGFFGSNIDVQEAAVPSKLNACVLCVLDLLAMANRVTLFYEICLSSP